MKTISRTIVKTLVEAEGVKYVDGEWQHRELDPVITSENTDKKKLEKYFEQRLLKDETLVIKKVTSEEKKYEVPLDEFIKLAEKYEKEQLKYDDTDKINEINDVEEILKREA